MALRDIIKDIRGRKRLANGDRLYLSRWDEEEKVFVPEEVAKELKRHHLLGIRFLYEAYRKQKKGCILNQDAGMNFQIQVAAFLNAVWKKLPAKEECVKKKEFDRKEPNRNQILIVSPKESLAKWHYHMTKHASLSVEILDESNKCRESNNKCGEKNVLLTSFDNLNLLNEHKKQDFFCVVVEDLDAVVNKMIVKQLKGRFKIGLTHENFLEVESPKIQWAMINWSNPGVVGKLGSFQETNEEHLKELRDPYDEWWQRLTWKYCENFQKCSPEETAAYERLLSDWILTHDIDTNSSQGKIVRKRRNIVRQKKLEKTECKKKKVVLSSSSSSSEEENISLENIPSENISTENISTENISSENISSKNIPIEKIPSKKIHTNKPSNKGNSSSSESSDENFILTSLMSGSSKKSPKKTTLNHFKRKLSAEEMLHDELFNLPMTSSRHIPLNMSTALKKDCSEEEEGGILMSMFKPNSQAIIQKEKEDQMKTNEMMRELFQEDASEPLVKTEEEMTQMTQEIKDKTLTSLFGKDFDDI